MTSRTGRPDRAPGVPPGALRAAVGCVAIVALLPAAALHAQDPIATDRPGIGSGSSVLSPGFIQLEVGGEYATADGLDTYSIGQAVVRFGIPGVELDLFVNSLVLARDEQPEFNPPLDGLSDMGVGVKIPVARGVASDRVNASLLVTTLAPIGADGISAEEWVAGTTALVDIAAAPTVAVSVNVGYEIRELTDESWSLIVTPTVALGETVGLYGGWAGSFQSGSRADVWEAGLTLLPQIDAQLDVNGGWESSAASPRDLGGHWYIGAGFAKRWGR